MNGPCTERESPCAMKRGAYGCRTEKCAAGRPGLAGAAASSGTGSRASSQAAIPRNASNQARCRFMMLLLARFQNRRGAHGARGRGRLVAHLDRLAQRRQLALRVHAAAGEGVAASTASAARFLAGWGARALERTEPRRRPGSGAGSGRDQLAEPTWEPFLRAIRVASSTARCRAYSWGRSWYSVMPNSPGVSMSPSRMAAANSSFTSARVLPA